MKYERENNFEADLKGCRSLIRSDQVLIFFRSHLTIFDHYLAESSIDGLSTRGSSGYKLEF